MDIKTDGKSGLDCALKGPYHLIILDIMLPGMDGFEICHRVRSVQKIPILMVTAQKEDIDKIRGLGLGADDYISKPFSPGELVARVKAHIAMLERLTIADDDTEGKVKELIVGVIRINQKTRRVYVKDIEVELKNKEYELLLFLVMNADIVFGKETLYERIWGMDAYGGQRDGCGSYQSHQRKNRRRSVYTQIYSNCLGCRLSV